MLVEVEAAKAHATVGREVQLVDRVDEGEHVVACGVDRCAQIHGGLKPVGALLAHPQIHAAQTAWTVT